MLTSSHLQFSYTYELRDFNMEPLMHLDHQILHVFRTFDEELIQHAYRVTADVLKLARFVNINENDLFQIKYGALLHDIGKIFIPKCILNKNGILTKEEFGIIKKHPIYADILLRPIYPSGSVLDIPYCHHEKWDGTGYPRGLKGEQIPLAARLFTIVDVWDALRSDRPYRLAWSIDHSIEYIQFQSGKFFEPDIVSAFFEMLNRDYIYPHRRDVDGEFTV